MREIKVGIWSLQIPAFFKAMRLKLAIAIPSQTTWPADFALCLLNLAMYVLQKPFPGYRQAEFKFFNKRSSILPKLRQELVEDAIKHNCTHLLFIDSDQTFPANLAHRLLSHGKDVVACNIVTKTIPAQPTARLKSAWPGGNVVYSDPDLHGLEQVWRVGTGVMLLNLCVFDKIQKPWFPMTYKSLGQDGRMEWEGEDWGFCSKLEDAGIPIFIDHDMSREIGHLGQMEYVHDLVGTVEQKEVVEA